MVDTQPSLNQPVNHPFKKKHPGDRRRNVFMA
jgi:hypothetical protein